MRGRLIVLEGPEGAGKTTQARRLAAHLESAGRPCLALREPGGTPLGDEIRALLLDASREISAEAEAMLFMASRAELMRTVVRPRLDEGTTIILDRFFLSTYAYQVVGRGLDEARIRAANSLATGGLVPHVTVLLTVDPGERGRRTRARGGSDRIEEAGDAFHASVDAAFAAFLFPDWQAAHPECGPIIGVDGAGREEEVFERLLRALAARDAETFTPVPGFL